jgi:hypothetical protein
MLIVDNAVSAQNEAQRFGMMIHDNVYAMPATEKQIEKLLELLKECNARIVNAVNAAVRAVGAVSANIDTDALCAQYMQQMMQNCKCVIGSSMTENSAIIEEDVEVIHPTHIVDTNAYDELDDEDFEDDDCDYCHCECCPNHHANQ